MDGRLLIKLITAPLGFVVSDLSKLIIDDSSP